MNNQRRYELDWLRVIAFGILIYFHAAIIFIPGGLPLIQNAETSSVINILVDFSHQFRLALLFLISGAGVSFAMQRRTAREFVLERSRRLLIPLVVGILLLVPIAVYFERLHLGQFSGTFFAFYPRFYTQGTYPSGNLSWHHFWFVAYLYIFCLLSMRGFFALKGRKGQVCLDRLAKWMQGPKILLVIPVLLIFELPLRAIFPGFRDLIHDWASFTQWLALFVVGFIIAERQQLLAIISAYRWRSLLLAIVSTGLLFGFFYGEDGFKLDPQQPDIVVHYILFCIVRITMIWSCLLTCIGFSCRYLSFGHPVLTYLNEAIYPLFIVHLTLIVIAGYYITPLTWSIAVKYFVITSVTVVAGLLIYQFVIKPFKVMRFLFGVKGFGMKARMAAKLDKEHREHALSELECLNRRL